jgi:hypothetical protein
LRGFEGKPGVIFNPLAAREYPVEMPFEKGIRLLEG